MIDRESRHPHDRLRRDADRGLVGVIALIAATALFPGDYFAINTSPAEFANLGIPVVNLPDLAGRGRREPRRPHGRRGLAGRRHGADLQRPARHARADGLLVPLRDHVRGALHPHHDRHRHAGRALPGAGVPRPVLRAAGAPGLAARRDRRRRCSWSRAWAYFIWTGSISTIWPMFGIANQLLASIALAVGTTIIINMRQGALRLGHAACRCRSSR